jgi:DNA-binding NarL/FixJ family response regulator
MERRNITVLIADDHQVFRTGLKTFLSGCPDFTVIGEAGDGQELVQLALELKPNVIITDIDMPVMSGIQAIKELCKHISYCRVLALSVHAMEDTVIRAIDAGAMGYILKSSETEEIKEAIYTLDNYKPYFCKTVSEMLTAIISRRFKVPAKTPVFFTDREIEIIKLICAEYTSKSIAYTLNLSKRTIEGHRTRIMDKIGAKSVAGLIAYAYETGIYKKGPQ